MDYNYYTDEDEEDYEEDYEEQYEEYEEEYEEDQDEEDEFVYYLNCPFEEKDDAKALGAKFDGYSRKWYVPHNCYTFISSFNRWKPAGRLYLECPYDEKDDAKKAGAKWDPIVKSWYVTNNKAITNQVKKWLPVPVSSSSSSSFPDDVVPSSVVVSSSSNSKGKKKMTTTTKPSPSAAMKKRGNAQGAAMLRISDAMTVGQLQEECRTRGTSGFSGKNKDYLLDVLGVGSIWQTMSMKHKKEEKEASKKKPAKTAPVKKQTAVKVKSTTPKGKATAMSSKARPHKKEATSKKSKATPPKLEKTTSINWNKFPNFTSSLTGVQLMHELLHRQPTIKGTSGKPKAWFLDRLGEGSIWSTSSEASRIVDADVGKVSSSLTVAQLTHELMSRGTTINGLSSKSKGDLLKLVGEGSIWTTAPSKK